MTKQMSNGKCSFCNATFSKAAMTKHLKSCKQRKAAPETSLEKRKLQKTKSLHFVVEGRDLPEYWMHLSVPANVTLEALDGFLRDIWLECCGHLSAFTIEGTRYSISPMREYGERSMKVALGDVLGYGMKFYHEYDFGTTTELTLRVVSELEGEVKSKSIQLLARNDPPLIACESCGKIATQVCAECIWSGKGWLCDKCSHKHECGEDMLLPVVNSPRVGMCGYTG
ncbi:MAG: plasmid pRiA4b ORF-3 family protein [Nitrospira sp.]|nr:plasmid pRiA4b ORF-3 family protein [Nitrospira sp.]